MAASSSMDTEAAGQELKGSGYTVSATAHAVDSDSWQQVGLLLVIGFNCAYVLSFSNLMMAPLGWGWGITCLLLVGAAAWYGNWLLAGLHFIDGQRFIRYRDLMGFVFGRKMYYITYFLQFTTLLLCNMGFILLGARALKAINVEFTHSPARLQWFITATGIVYFAFAYFVPTISAMRNWLATSAALTLAYGITLLAILIRDGKSNEQKDFNVHAGSPSEKVFNALGAVAAILVCNTSGLLPEIQVWIEMVSLFFLLCLLGVLPSQVLKQPVRRRRRVWLPACVDGAGAGGARHAAGAAAAVHGRRGGVLRRQRGGVLGVRVVGVGVPPQRARQLGGPRWAAVLINAAAFLQSIVSQHLFVVPIHEAMDTQLQRLDEGMFSRYNLTRRLFARGLIFGFNVFVTALFPFMGDFVNLIGSFALVPLTFTFPSMVILKIKGKSGGRWNRLWHWGIIVFSTVLCVATTAAAARLIFNNARIYHFFADM